MEPSAPWPQLLLIRHGATEWNERKLYQGRRDLPLLKATEITLLSLEPREEFKNWKLYSSPLVRAQKTASLLFRREPELVPGAVELDFGDWEGMPIHREDPAELHEGNAYGWTGLDARPPGGESPREAQARMSPWLKQFHERGENAVLITHKGLIQALLAQAWGWEMDRKRPHKVDYSLAQRLEVGPEGRLRVLRLNEEHSSRS